MKLAEIWHYARPKLAASYLQLLRTGLVVSTTMFAPRRTGKTSFLRQDLTPAAQKAGFTVAYVDLWQTRLSPGVALVRGLEEALEPRTLAQKAMRRLQTPVKKVKAAGTLGDAKAEMEVELADPKKEASDLALRIDELMAQLCRKAPLLLLVDEAQELARNRDNELVATALRTAITKHRDQVRVVFTGSSRTRLAHVFSNADAPLYSVGAAIQEFPLLDRDFVEFVAEKFHTATQRTLDVAVAWTEFQAFKQQPEPFLAAVVASMMAPEMSLADACGRERLALANTENHAGTWTSLDGLQQALVKLLADNPAAKPFSKAVLAQLAKELGLQTLDATSVQFALKKLAERTVVDKSPRGLYVFENQAFEQWVRTTASDVPEA